MVSTDSLTGRDRLILTAYCVLLFGIAVISGRPLTLHECVLPQTARSMFNDGDLVVPKINGRTTASTDTLPLEPWLESPPLPQWITVALAVPFGRCDSESIVRIGPVLVATWVVLLTAWMASLWYGRPLGLLAGLVLATTVEMTRYGWLAEDEIYLCGIVTTVVALFVKMEFAMPSAAVMAPQPGIAGFLRGIVGARSLWMVVFFVALGATNLVKGLMFGTVMSLVPIGGFLVLSLQPQRIAKYVWVWGAALFVTVMFAWPLAAYLRYPDAFDVWYFDLFGRLKGTYREINEPIWYYPVNLLWMLLPWTLMVPFGMARTASRAWRDRGSPERFLWCWALLVPAVFSIPGGKHHHYLLHALAPWAILGALGLQSLRALATTWPRWLTHPLTNAAAYGIPAGIALYVLRAKVPGPEWLPWGLMAAAPVIAGLIAWTLLDRRGMRPAVVIFTLLWGCYVAGHFHAAQYIDSNRQDVAFLKSVRARVGDEPRPLLIDMSANSFHGMMGLFYMPDGTRLLHNLSFLGATEISEPEVYVVAMASLQNEISRWGATEALESSQRIPRGRTSRDKLTLFRLRFDPGIERVSASTIRVSPMQAMNRVAGPFLTESVAGAHTTTTALR